MILPIIAYGDPVLREIAKDVYGDYPGLEQLIDDMFETMYNAQGIGLAAPQVGHSIRLFVIDSSQVKSTNEQLELEPLKEVFINAKRIAEPGEMIDYEEGCLSLPGIREDVMRPDAITIEYSDRNWMKHKKTFTGLNARVIQHEYDHIEGILFTDRLKPLKKRFLRKKLSMITKGEVEVPYKMRFPMERQRF